MERWFGHYIPAGCLKVCEDTVSSAPEDIARANFKVWQFIRRHNEISGKDDQHLDPAIENALMCSSTLAPFVELYRAHWIGLSYCNSIIRVYIFPHDVDRRARSRAGDVKLSKTLGVLLKCLDFSPDTWAGLLDAPPWSHPAPTANGSCPKETDCSLLDRFNQLPSPDPQLDSVTSGSFNAIAMQGILDSRLPGLHTTLYAHQRRSAAVMLQREVEPGRVIDPRLRCAFDQDNKPWYFDTETGLVLKEPRYYDRASGGILAEEMGTGKTLICLAVILATKYLPTEAPDALTVEIPTRTKVGSLVDMAAATINRYSFPWKEFLASTPSEPGQFVEGCVRALDSKENRAYYEHRNPLVVTRKTGRITAPEPAAEKIYLSSISLIIVPNNLVTQWQQEITKHTSGLKVLTMTDTQISIPPVSVLLSYNVILFSEAHFASIERWRSAARAGRIAADCPLDYIHFKRCIVDEGHKLGSSRGASWKSDLTRGLGRLHIAARWVVTGTPSRGLYGALSSQKDSSKGQNITSNSDSMRVSNNQEREDLQRIGSIASNFLKVRPWSNTRDEIGDTPANWNVYVLQPRHHNKSGGRVDCLKATLESLIIRNRLADVSHYLPPVEEKLVVLDGSFQDKLSLNLFSMMIIFNSVQSQRTDQDYIFHPRQRKALDELVGNLKQASFFGGVFYSVADITKSLETAQTFLDEKKIPISADDYELITKAIEFGKLAVGNRLKEVSNQYHSMPLYLEHFPGGNGKHWSLDNANTNENDLVCSDASLIHQLQKFLNPCIDAPTSLKRIIENGELAWQGALARARAAEDAAEAGDKQDNSNSQTSALAGNTKQGVDRHIIRKTNIPSDPATDLSVDIDTTAANVEIAEPLAKTRIISTVSAKLSYLIDSIMKHQDDEQIIVFYENDNVAWYLAGVFEILQIQHLIYTRKGLNAQRRAQYVSTFTHNPKFRVLLMDISQAAFGLDMRSASRIYFISPVLNPQVETQAIGRARRISQQKPVTVETLVLRDSIEEVIVERRKNMTQAEHRKVKNILDDKPMHDWILNAKIIPMPVVDGNNVAQTAKLRTPQYVFGRGFGREADPDADLITTSPTAQLRQRETEQQPDAQKLPIPFRLEGVKRSRTPTPTREVLLENTVSDGDPPVKKKKTVRIAFADDA